jgi:hypothetical protein
MTASNLVRSGSVDRSACHGRDGRRIVGQRIVPAARAQPIDVALRQHRAQPRAELAAPVEIPEQRLPRAASAVAHAIEIGVQRVGEIAGVAGGIDGVGRPVEQWPMHGDEGLPRLVLARRTGDGQREVFQMERRHIALGFLRRGRSVRKCVRETDRERGRKGFTRHRPPLGARGVVQALEQRRVERGAG